LEGLQDFPGKLLESQFLLFSNIPVILGELCYDPLANRLPELLKFKGFFEDRLFPGGQFLEVQSLPTNSYWIYSRLTPTQRNSIFV
jgi:hypothetical protein